MRIARFSPRAAFAAVSIATLALSQSLTMAHAADIAAQSKIDAVTVYPASAEVVRITKVRIPAGEHAVLLTDLPPEAIPQSIRVEGKATGALQIGSVDTRRTSVSRGDQEQLAQERKRIEGQIETLNDRKAQLQTEITAAEQQQVLIKNLAEMPGRPVPVGTQPGATPDWAQLFALIGERTAAVQKTILDTRLKLRDIDRQIQDLSGKLGGLAPAVVQRTEVRVNVAAETAVEADLTVRYQVNGAAWTPLYDARLQTAAKGVAAKLQLIRRAAIQQRTGESWADVALTLSTTRPTAGTAAPELPMLGVDFQPPPAPPVAMSAPRPSPAASATRMEGVTADEDGRRKMRSVAEAAPEPVIAQVVQSTLDNKAFQALFSIPGRVTVPANGEVKRVQIAQDELEPQLIVRATPGLDVTAYLYAKLVAPKAGAPVLPGQVSLFRDGTFVGNGQMAQLAPGEDHELGFGIDDRIKVRSNTLEDKKGERGILTTSRVEERNFEVIVKNLHANPMLVQIIDRIPVSANEAIKVEPQFRRPEPTKRDYKDRRGVMMWEFTVQPDQEQTIGFGYKVSSPTDRPIVYNRDTPTTRFGGQVRF